MCLFMSQAVSPTNFPHSEHGTFSCTFFMCWLKPCLLRNSWSQWGQICFSGKWTLSKCAFRCCTLIPHSGHSFCFDSGSSLGLFDGGNSETSTHLAHQKALPSIIPYNFLHSDFPQLFFSSLSPSEIAFISFLCIDLMWVNKFPLSLHLEKLHTAHSIFFLSWLYFSKGNK